LLAAPVLAATTTATQTNTTTGPFSINKNIVKIKETVKTISKNIASAANFIGITGNTGGNEQNKNTTAGTMTTGDVNVTLNITTVQNSGPTSTPVPTVPPI